MFDDRLEPRGYQSRLSTLNGLKVALRCCVDQPADGPPVSLAQHTRRVPEEYVSRACTIGRGPETLIVTCVCDATTFVAAELVECRGGCGRWLIADDTGAFAIRPPDAA